MSKCNNRYYMRKARIHDRISPKTFLTLNDCMDIMNQQDKKIDELNNNEYRLLEKNVELENKLDYLTEAIQTNESEYRLKTRVAKYTVEANLKLQAIQEIRKQYELIKLREETQ